PRALVVLARARQPLHAAGRGALTDDGRHAGDASRRVAFDDFVGFPEEARGPLEPRPGRITRSRRSPNPSQPGIWLQRSSASGITRSGVTRKTQNPDAG